MRAALESDYLVVGAGAAGMAFTDALLSHSDATVTIVDRRHAPGGALGRRLSVRAAPSAVRVLRRRLRAARAGRHRRDRDERRLLRARRRERAKGLLRTGHASPFPAHRAGPVLPLLRLRRRASLHLPAHWRVEARARAPQTDRHRVPGGRGPGDEPSALRDGRRRPLRDAERARLPRAPARAPRDHRRRQDRARHVRVAARAGRPGDDDPLDPAARSLVDEPQVPAAARAPAGPLARHRDPARGHGPSRLDG
jgi:hypothetical protein